MDTHALELFLEVARLGSISGAARSLSYSQSNISARIQQLEQDLETPLFERKSHGVELTAAGAVLQRHAQRILGLLDEAARSVRDTPELTMFRLGATETTSAVRLPALLVALRRARPDVEFHLTSGPTTRLVEGLRDGSLDGAFVGIEPDPDEVESRFVFDEDLVVIAPRSWTRLDAEPVDLIVFGRDCSYRPRLEAWARDMTGAEPRVLEFGALEPLISCVEDGSGISFLPRELATRPEVGARVSLHEIAENYSRIPLYYASVRGRGDAAFHAELMEFATLP